MDIKEIKAAIIAAKGRGPSRGRHDDIRSIDEDDARHLS